MVRAVLNERQTSDCDFLCRITLSLDVSCIRASIRLKNQYDVFVKVMQYVKACFQPFRSYILFKRQPLVGGAAKHYGRFTPIFAIQFTRISYAHVLSLELAELATTTKWVVFNYFDFQTRSSC